MFCFTFKIASSQLLSVAINNIPPTQQKHKINFDNKSFKTIKTSESTKPIMSARKNNSNNAYLTQVVSSFPPHNNKK